MEYQLKTNHSFKSHISGKNIVIQFKTQDNLIARYYMFRDGEVQSAPGAHDAPTLMLEFVDSVYGYDLLKNYLHDGQMLMNNVSRGYVNAIGDISLVTWFCALSQIMSSGLVPWRKKQP